VSVPVFLYAEKDFRNVLKYPLMRRMFYDTKYRDHTLPYVMWFDDDSYVHPGRRGWWADVASMCAEHTLVGSTYRQRLRGSQHLGIMAQPWYGGKPVRPGHAALFCQGGWWVARLADLKELDYPFLDLRHNGGDSLLGEAYRQKGWTITRFKRGVSINADARGKESAAERRGVTTRWPWERWPETPDHSHHDFEAYCFRVNNRAGMASLSWGKVDGV